MSELGISGKSGSVQNQLKLLKWIKTNIRAPDTVIDYGYNLLKHHKSSLGHSVWDVYEQVCVAALDVHNGAIAKECLTALSVKFPKSSRVKRLHGLALEANGGWDDAATIYDELLEADPSNQAVWKRKVCLLRTRGDLKEAAIELSKYLAVFSTDESAWMELADLYVAQAQYDLAAFCYEELILIEPENYLYHLLYAEVVYTAGGKDNFETARLYFAQSIELKPHDNLRAVCGLAMCLRALRSLATSVQRSQYHDSYTKQVVPAILQTYQSSHPDRELINAVLNEQ